MTTLADDIVATKVAVDALNVKIDAVAAPTVDLTSVLAAIAAVDDKIGDLEAKFTVTV